MFELPPPSNSPTPKKFKALVGWHFLGWLFIFYLAFKTPHILLGWKPPKFSGRGFVWSQFLLKHITKPQNIFFSHMSESGGERVWGLEKVWEADFQERNFLHYFKGIFGGSSCPEIHEFRCFLVVSYMRPENRMGINFCIGKISRFGGWKFHSKNSSPKIFLALGDHIFFPDFTILRNPGWLHVTSNSILWTPIDFQTLYGCFQKIGVPQKGWFIIDLGVPLFAETSIWFASEQTFQNDPTLSKQVKDVKQVKWNYHEITLQ